MRTRAQSPNSKSGPRTTNGLWPSNPATRTKDQVSPWFTYTRAERRAISRLDRGAWDGGVGVRHPTILASNPRAAITSNKPLLVSSLSDDGTALLQMPSVGGRRQAILPALQCAADSRAGR